jgi:hypothetical protein
MVECLNQVGAAASEEMTVRSFVGWEQRSAILVRPASFSTLPHLSDEAPNIRL